jgi:hypothetical protein
LFAITGAQPETFDPFWQRPRRADKDDRNVPGFLTLLKATADFKSVYARQADIQQD